MLKLLNIIFLVFFLVSCTTKIIKKDITTKIRDVEVTSDDAGIKDTVDLANISKDWDDIKIIDSTVIEIGIPKKIVLPAKKKTVYLDDKTSVEVEVSAVIDSGRLEYEIDIPKVAFQESTITEILEIDTSPNYIRWIIIIVIGFLAVLLFTILRR